MSNEQPPIDPSKPIHVNEYVDLTAGNGIEGVEAALDALKGVSHAQTNPNDTPDGSASESRESLVAAFGLPEVGTPEYEEAHRRALAQTAAEEAPENIQPEPYDGTQVERALAERRPEDIIGPSASNQDYNRIAAAAASGDLEGLTAEERHLAEMLQNAAKEGDTSVRDLHVDTSNVNSVDLRDAS